MANSQNIGIPDLDPDLNAVLELSNPNDLNLKHFLITTQMFRNLSLVLQNIANLEQKMSDQINALTAEVNNVTAVMTAAGGVLDATLAAEATLKDQLAKATNPADQQALQDATNKLAAARATLQTEIDKANAANPPAPSPAPAPTGTATSTAAPSPTPSPAPSPAAPATGS